MKTVSFKNRKQGGRLLGEIGKQLSIDRVFDNLQGALVYIDQFGFCAGLIKGSFLLISFVLQGEAFWR